MTDTTDATVQPLLVGAQGAAALVGLSRASWYRLHSSGGCPRPIRIRGRVLWRVEELRDWTRAGCPCRAHWEKMKKGS